MGARERRGRETPTNVIETHPLTISCTHPNCTVLGIQPATQAQAPDQESNPLVHEPRPTTEPCHPGPSELSWKRIFQSSVETF